MDNKYNIVLRSSIPDHVQFPRTVISLEDGDVLVTDRHNNAVKYHYTKNTWTEVRLPVSQYVNPKGMFMSGSLVLITDTDQGGACMCDTTTGQQQIVNTCDNFKPGSSITLTGKGVIVVGGKVEGNPVNSVHKVNYHGGWLKLQPVPIRVYDHHMVELPSGDLILLGGHDEYGPNPRVFLYSITVDVWTELPSLPFTIDEMEVTLINDYNLLITDITSKIFDIVPYPTTQQYWLIYNISPGPVPDQLERDELGITEHYVSSVSAPFSTFNHTQCYVQPGVVLMVDGVGDVADSVVEVVVV